QVTFKTPSPAISPNPSEASSDSHRSQLSTPPLLLSSSNSRESNTTSPMPQQQQIPSIGFPGSQMNSYNQQHIGEGQYLRQQFTGQQAWPVSNNQTKPRPTSQQQNQNQNNHPNSSVLNPGPMFNPRGNIGGPGNMGPVPPLIQQLRPNLPLGPADQLLSGLLQRPPPPRMEGFAQMPPPPMVDSANRMREPGPQVLDMMGMNRPPPPIMSGMEGFGMPGGARNLDEQLQQQKKQQLYSQQQQQFKNLPRLPQGAQLPFLSLSGHQEIEIPNSIMSNLQMKSSSGLQSFNLENRQQGQMGNMNSNRSMHQMDPDNPQGSIGPNLSGPPPPLTGMWGSGSPNNQFDSAKGFQMAHPNLANLLHQQQQQQQQQQQHQQQHQQQLQQQHGTGSMGPVDAGSGDGGMVSSRPPPLRVSTVPSSVPHSVAGHQQTTLHTSNPRSPPGLTTGGGGLPTLPPGGLPSMPPLGLLSMTSHPPPPISNMNINQNQRMHQPFRTEGIDNESSGGSTYSLFSPMSGSGSAVLGGSVGLGSGGLSGMGAGPRSNVPHPLYPTASQPAPQQIGQSLWSGPGPSPLERLLEQKKYSSVPK
ncbi:unnamed protein product, partial [Meganyctiphanes norvegica]